MWHMLLKPDYENQFLMTTRYEIFVGDWKTDNLQKQ